jgi:exopolysaccharide biosynthesis protein
MTNLVGRRSKLTRRLLALGVTVVLGVSAVGYWGLDRYVVDHVAIGDVAAYEAALSPSPAVPAAPETSAPEPVVTATSYLSGTTSIEISTVVEGTGSSRVTYYVADVFIGDGTQLRGGFAENKFGRNIVKGTSDIAESYNAIFAVNGDYYGFRDNGILIRNGVLYRDNGARNGLAIYRNGTMAVYDERTTTGAELLAAGVWNTMSFGPALVNGGAIQPGIDQGEVDNNFGLRSIQGNNPRTGIGLIDTNHLVFVVVDGRSAGYSRGVTMTEFAQIFENLGATVAYNLDGGGSSTMYFNGALVNKPQGKDTERAISDILYIA